MRKQTLWLFATLAFCITGTLASCGTIAEELLFPLTEYDMNKSVNNAKPGNTTNSKRQAKEREKLIQEGKCPTCQGMGKTPDGRYTCTDCNGTGKYQSASK